MSHFAQAYAHVLEIEGGYSDHKYDRGGKTRYGITERVARAHGYVGPMDQLPEYTAKAIYRTAFWDISKLDVIADLSYPIALEIFDTGVNMGVGRAARMLQRALNGLNNRASIFADMEVDGIIGMVTVSALKDYLTHRAEDGESVLKKSLNGFQVEAYFQIVESDPTQEINLYGWVRQRVT